MSNKRNDIVRFILKEFPKANIKFDNSVISNSLVTARIPLGERSVRFDIFEEDTYEQIKNRIDKYFQLTYTPECPICLEKITTRSIGCFKCLQRTCLNCAINIIRHNHGLLVCAYCRFEDGYICLPEEYERNIAKLRLA